jgi:hypothetical protein
MDLEIKEFVIRTKHPEAYKNLINTIKSLYSEYLIRIIGPQPRCYASLLDSPSGAL